MSNDKPAKAFSCVRCFERKVKCDKTHPCAGCVRSNVECIFRVPAAPRRRKKLHADEAVLARLRHYETLLQANGIEPTFKSPDLTSSPSDGATLNRELSGGDTDSPDPIKHGSQHSTSLGRLLVDQGKSRFVENFLWSSLSDQFDPNDAMAGSSEDEDSEGIFEENQDFIIGINTSNPQTTTSFHPSPAHAYRMWQFYLENVHPMTKILHQPSLEPVLVKASSKPESVPKGIECLLFAIYSMVILSLSETQCEQTFGESRKVLLSRYQEGVRRALARAKFMATSDIEVLQAYVLYLLSMRLSYDARTLWTMCGIASRIAQSLGIHRDGTVFGLPPFETEMRRRLWWQISIIDFRAAELTGSGRFGDALISNSMLSSNYDDVDIYPGMTEFPPERTRPGEMICNLMRCEFARFWKEKILFSYPQKITYRTSLSDFITTAATVEERDRNVDELETVVQEKFLKYCDPSVPIHFQTSLTGRSALTGMRMMAHHPKRWRDDSEIPPEEKRKLWEFSLKLLEIDNLCYTYPPVQRFQWHSRVFFQWQALIFLLSDLQNRTLGPEVDKAWTYIEQCFDNHPNYIEDRKQPVHVAVGNLTLKAYGVREEALIQKGTPHMIPKFIQTLRQQRQPAPRPSKPSLAEHLASSMGMGMHMTSLTGFLRPTYVPRPMQTQMDMSSAGVGTIDSTVSDYYLQDMQSGSSNSNDYNNGGNMSYMYGEIPNDWTQWEHLFSTSNGMR